MDKRLVVATLVTVLASVSACGGGGDDSGIEPLEPEPTASVIAGTSATDPGERPDDERSEAGAIAFSEFAVKSIIAAGVTGDADVVLTLANPQCEVCITYARSITEDPDSAFRYDGEVAVRDAEIVEQADDQFVVNQLVEVPAGQEVDTADGEDTVSSTFDESTQEFRLLLRWSGSRWLIENYASENVQ